MTPENPFSLAQIIGYGAMISSVSSLSFKSNRLMNKVLIFTNSLWLLHFLMLGAPAGGINCGVHVMRSIGFLFYAERQNRWRYFWIFIALYSAAGFFTIKHSYDFLPLIGSYATCSGLYLFNGIRTKLSFAFANGCIFLYSAIVFSIGGMISMLTGLVIVFITILRLQKENAATSAKP